MPRHTRVVPVGWSESETEALLARVRAEGNQGFYTYAKESGKTYDACRMYLQRTHREAWLEAMEAWRIAQFRNPVTAPKEKGPNRTDEIADWWDTFKPVSLPAPKRAKANVTANTGVTIVASDLHFPLQDDAAVSVLLRTIEELRPERVVLNGDLPDLLAISKYPKDVRQTWSLHDEAVAFHGFLRALEEVLPADAALIEIDANHSGDGTESRWWRYLSDRIPELLKTPRALQVMSYPAWWHPEWSRIQMKPELVIAEDLLITHGTFVRRGGGMSAKAHSESYLNSVMHGHTHRQGSSMRRVPAIGSRGEQVIKAYEIGCLCRLDPGYVSVPDWTQGFAIVVEGEGRYGVELVTIEEGAAVVTTLGKTIRA